jgi:hypothetical protein
MISAFNSLWSYACSPNPFSSSFTLLTTAIREVHKEIGILIGSEHVAAKNLRDWQLSNVYEIYPVWRHRYAEGVTHNTGLTA